jgi:prepilin-type N-terminal cleavage/methylation domain-containing protein
MSIKSRASEGGFSLVELMVAMTVTLIVSGAIYGLLTSGGNAFRREPELADRQQNIRVAMDLISRDVFNAGAALPTYSQVFSRVDPGSGPCAGGLNGCGPAGTMGSAAATSRGSDSENTDVLELVAADERCPVQTVCSVGVLPGSAGAFVTREGIPACMTLPGLALLTDNTSFTVQPAAANAAAACTGGNSTRNGSLTLGAFLAPWNDTPAMQAANPNPPPLATTPPQVFLYRGRIVRYMIAPGTDPRDPSPSLWRSESGLYTTAGAAAPAPGAANSPWELVARGIEDLQIEYRSGVPTASWANQPPISTANNWNSIVRGVRISLSARVTAVNLQGATVAAGGGAPNAIRGQLVTVVAPRAGFNELQMGNQIQ